MPFSLNQLSQTKSEILRIVKWEDGSSYVNCLISGMPCTKERSHVLIGAAASEACAKDIHKMFADAQTAFTYTVTPQIHHVTTPQPSYHVMIGVRERYKPVLTFLEQEVRKAGDKISQFMILRAQREAITLLPMEQAVALVRKLPPHILSM